MHINFIHWIVPSTVPFDSCMAVRDAYIEAVTHLLAFASPVICFKNEYDQWNVHQWEAIFRLVPFIINLPYLIYELMGAKSYS